MSFIYIMKNDDWFKNGRKYKFGYTTRLNRLNDSKEMFSGKKEYIYIVELKRVGYPETADIDKIFTHCKRNFKPLNDVKKYLVHGNGGKEFIYHDGLELFKNFIKNEIHHFKVEFIREYTQEEIDEINQDISKSNSDGDSSSELLNFFDGLDIVEDNNKYSKRPYQIEAIQGCIKNLDLNNKVYLELATGGGKTYIVFNILSHYNPETIIIFSPLKKINEQNIKDDYVQLLSNEYKIINLSENNVDNLNNFLKLKNRKIIVGCIHSIEKLYNCLIKSEYKNIFVWFDEAHFGVENWITDDNLDKYNEVKQFWLEDSKFISKRIFVSASPNKYLIEDKENEKYFGQLYTPISVSELIEQKWLAPIEPYFNSQIKSNPSLIKYIINNFKKHNRNWGFSFHSKQLNAFSLFYEHFIKFKNGMTNIKPFLLVGDDFKNLILKICKNFPDVIKDNIKTIRENNINFKGDEFYKLINLDRTKVSNILKQNTNDNIIVDLKDPESDLKNLFIITKKFIEMNEFFSVINYNYCSIEEYELNNKSIGYVVQKFSMGYDFKNIDYIIFSDNKSSFKDIIQSIGRGTRPDKLGINENGILNGKNKDKVLKFFLPIFYDLESSGEKNYDLYNVIEVLGYLKYNYCMNLYDIILKDFNNGGNTKIEEKEDGNENIESTLLKELYLKKILQPVNLKELYKILKQFNINNEKEYNIFKRTQTEIKFKENLSDYKLFNWKEILDPKGNIYYSSLNECKVKFDKLKITLKNDIGKEKFKKLTFERLMSKINNLDPKIPEVGIDNFYPK
jgi:hypothetical protein